MLRQEEVDVEANVQMQQRKNLKAMKALVRNLKLLPLAAKIKRKRGQCGRNKYPEGQWVVNIVSAVGQPIDPPEVCAKFWNKIGSIIRTKMVLDPTIPSWPLVPEGRKEAM